MKFAIGWALLTIPVFVLGTALISLSYEGMNPVSKTSLKAGLVVVLPLWWGLYFLVSP